MKKDILRRAFLWVLAVLMLTGIAMPAALAEEEPCTLWLVTEESTSDGMNAAITAEAAQFEEENPGVSIKIDILPNQKNIWKPCGKKCATEKGLTFLCCLPEPF